MDYKERYGKLRLLVKSVNKERKKQAQKMDILCNDLVDAQRDFIKALDAISFTAFFYKSIIGITDLDGLFHIADKLIKEEIAGVRVVFFLRHRDSHEMHTDKQTGEDKQRLENCFNSSLVENICESNKVCSLDDLLAMGLEAAPLS